MANLYFVCLCKGSDAKRCACQAQYDAILKRIAQLEAALEKCAEGAFILQQRGELINIANQALEPALRGTPDG